MRTGVELKWDEILARGDVQAGELETKEYGVRYRGPIERVEISGDNRVTFRQPWVERQNIIGEWERWHPLANTFQLFAEKSPPRYGEDGRIHFNLPGGGCGTITPKSGSP